MFHLLRAIIRLNPNTVLIPMMCVTCTYFVANAINVDTLCRIVQRVKRIFMHIS